MYVWYIFNLTVSNSQLMKYINGSHVLMSPQEPRVKNPLVSGYQGSAKAKSSCHFSRQSQEHIQEKQKYQNWRSNFIKKVYALTFTVHFLILLILKSNSTKQDRNMDDLFNEKLLNNYLMPKTNIGVISNKWVWKWGVLWLIMTNESLILHMYIT